MLHPGHPTAEQVVKVSGGQAVVLVGRLNIAELSEHSPGVASIVGPSLLRLNTKSLDRQAAAQSQVPVVFEAAGEDAVSEGADGCRHIALSGLGILTAA